MTPINISEYAEWSRNRWITHINTTDNRSLHVRDNYYLVQKIVQDLGGTIKPYDIDDFTPLIDIAPHGKPFTIYVSPVTSPLRDTVTITRALAMYFMYYKESEKQVKFWNRFLDKRDVEVEHFMLSFLMPKEEFTEYMKDYKYNDYYLLGGHFGVPKEVAEQRLEQLNANKVRLDDR